MNGYIDKEKAKDEIARWDGYLDNDMIARIQIGIGRMPSADVKEVKHGNWIKMSDADGEYYCCSECGEELYRMWVFDREFDISPKKKSIDKMNFCPNCGAEMRGENDV